jgi:hypothetical protein
MTLEKFIEDTVKSLPVNMVSVPECMSAVMDSVNSQFALNPNDESHCRAVISDLLIERENRFSNCTHKEIGDYDSFDGDGGCLLQPCSCLKCGKKFYKWFEVINEKSIWNMRSSPISKCNHQIYEDLDLMDLGNVVVGETRCCKCGFIGKNLYKLESLKEWEE